MVRVLLIDDDPACHVSVREVLPAEYQLSTAEDAADGTRLAAQEEPDIVLLDIDLPDASGLEVLPMLAGLPDPPAVIMVTGMGDVPTVVSAIRRGARDFLVKPLSRDTLLGTLQQVAGSRLATRIQPPHAALAELVGECPAMLRLKESVARYGPTDAPLLVTGESGTGKEVVAKLAHTVSGRSGEFVAVNCAAIPESLLGSELFGSEKGAFTDAVSRPGAFEQAQSGTLFLDELGDMPSPFQNQLLRVLEAKTVRRMGGSGDIALDVRLICATNRDLVDMRDAGSFRPDLFYRIAVLPLHVPPLRQRLADVTALAYHFLEPGLELDAEAKAALERHSWPGNVRELRNVLTRSRYLLDQGETMIRARHLVFV